MVTVTQEAAAPPVPAVSALRTQAQALEEGWSVVARKKKKSKPPTQPNVANRASAPRPRPKPLTPAAARGPRMKEPNAAVVVLTLLPAAVEKGVTYADVMAKAKANIRLGDLGIAGLKLKTARTGARTLLLPGKENLEKADAIAAKLKSSFLKRRDDWAGDLDGSVIIIVRTAAACPPLTDIVRGSGYVVATIGEVVVIATYFSPNRRLVDFESWLYEVGTVVARNHSRPVLVLGDFNAKSTAWGSPRTCARGEALEQWAITKGLVIMNRGSVHTCVRQHGGSIVDLTFASPALARRVRDWRVLERVETLSDHRYIRFSVSTRSSEPPSLEAPVGECPRWALRKLDREVFREALIVATSSSEPDVEPLQVEQEAEDLRSLVTGICDAAMPRGGRFRPSRQVYWWCPTLEALRRAACLAQGRFPARWRTGKLVLLRKEGRPADSPSAYRPIVLLDEVGKLFERIIADRLVQHLTSTGPDLADNQFGFRLAGDAVFRGEVLLAVSLDIANAFNTLPWACVRKALRYFGVPTYLRQTDGAYLNERAVIYPVHGGGWSRRAMVCGVPQGSVLSPLLWNIAYDWTLRCRILPGVSVICYADDTLIAARGRTHRRACILGTAGVSQIVGRIRRLGVEVALQKTEAVIFHGPRNRPPPDTNIVVGGVRIGIGETMKYLGLVLDSRWDFSAHSRQLAPKLKRAAGALSRLLPNIGGPEATCRKLFKGIVRSMAFYGAPVWADHQTARNVALLRQAQRVLAVRAIRGYRTVSFEAASLLAGSPP
ncbi:hypothetical protein K1T71_015318 [Dendrolimus kikuchii]|nr:hypothetical protein K1T71_015318 [Dendrolimus kikuchii]